MFVFNDFLGIYFLLPVYRHTVFKNGRALFFCCIFTIPTLRLVPSETIVPSPF